MRCSRVSLLLVLACAAPAVAQQRRADLIRQRAAAMQPRSVEWFQAQAELVEALFDVDVAASLAVADAGWHAAAGGGVPGAAEVMAALAELATCKLEGPAKAGEWASRSTTPPAGTSVILMGHYHLARARTLCKHGEHAEELRSTIAGQEAAESVGDPVLQLELALHNTHATPLREASRVRKLLDDALTGPRAMEVASLRPWISLHAYTEAGDNGVIDDAAHLLDEAERVANEEGSLRVVATVLGYRASRFLDRSAPYPDADAAMATIVRAVEMFSRIGDRRDHAVAIGVQGMVEARRGAFDRAAETLTRAANLVKDRGMRECEMQLRHARFDIAVRSGDGNRAAELLSELERENAVAADEAREVRRVQAELERHEKEHAERVGLLEFAVRLADERAQRTMLWAVAGACVALGLLAFVTWRSRRRLLVVNRRLAEQITRTEAATAASTELEARMRQLERTQALGAIAAGVAHDFNNLLTAILGNAEVIAMTSRNDEVGELARRIVAAGKQAARMCHQMQQCAVDEPIQVEPMDLLRLFHDMLPVLSASVGDRVEIVIATVADRLGAVVDRSQLEQVLLNLVVNARDAKATRVVLRTAAAPIDESDPTRTRMVTIEVADNGEGMTADVAQRIFDPFFTTRFPGRGLGLAVASSIVSRHGGRIEVHSEQGRGTTFTILLPAAVPTAVKEPTVVLPSAVPRPLRQGAEVVVVDDDDGVRRVLVGMLRSLGCRVTEFSDGAVAIAALAAAVPDQRLVMFVDLTMPNMEGHEVVRRVRAVRPDVRIVLMSGHAGAHVGHVARDLEPDAVLAKPFSYERLRELLVALEPQDPVEHS